MKKKFVKYGMVWTLIMGMALSALRLCVPEDGSIRAQAQEKQVAYVITAKSENALERVCDKYNGILDAYSGENSDVLTGEGVAVSGMTASQAEMLRGDSLVVSVEKDIMLQGSADKKKKTAKSHGQGGRRNGKKRWVKDGVAYVDAGKDANWNLESIMPQMRTVRFQKMGKMPFRLFQGKR